MHGTQCSGHQNGQYRYVCNRRPLVYHNGRWFDQPSIPPRGLAEDGTLFNLFMEPGGPYTTSACRGDLNLPVFFARKGVIWVFVAIVFGVVPVVSLTVFRNIPSFTSHLARRSSVAWISVVFYSISCPEIRDVDIAPFFSQNTRPAQHGTFLTSSSEQGLFVVKPHGSSDVPISVVYCNDNRHHKDVPCSPRLFIAGRVGYSSLHIFFTLNGCGPSRRHTYESPRTGGAKILIKGTRRTPSGPIPLSKISVDVQTYRDDSTMTPHSSGGGVSAGSMEKQVKYAQGLVRDPGQ